MAVTLPDVLRSPETLLRVREWLLRSPELFLRSRTYCAAQNLVKHSFAHQPSIAVGLEWVSRMLWDSSAGSGAPGLDLRLQSWI